MCILFYFILEVENSVENVSAISNKEKNGSLEVRLFYFNIILQVRFFNLK